MGKEHDIVISTTSNQVSGDSSEDTHLWIELHKKHPFYFGLEQTPLLERTEHCMAVQELEQLENHHRKACLTIHDPLLNRLLHQLQ